MRNRDNTGVDTICNYGNGSQVPDFDKAKVYQELKSMTNSITKLGIYSLDNMSLYVNGKRLMFSFLQTLEQFGTTSGVTDHFSVITKKSDLKEKLVLLDFT